MTSAVAVLTVRFPPHSRPSPSSASASRALWSRCSGLRSGAELLLGKALAVLLPSVVIAYAVFGVFLGLVALLARIGVASAFIRGPDVLAQVVFTPLLAGWSIWLGIAISTRVSEARVAQQLSTLASLPTIAVTT